MSQPSGNEEKKNACKTFFSHSLVFWGFVCITGIRDVEQIAYGSAYLEDTTSL